MSKKAARNVATADSNLKASTSLMSIKDRIQSEKIENQTDNSFKSIQPHSLSMQHTQISGRNESDGNYLSAENINEFSDEQYYNGDDDDDEDDEDEDEEDEDDEDDDEEDEEDENEEEIDANEHFNKIEPNINDRVEGFLFVFFINLFFSLV
jgi:hypothetical protein